MSYKFPDHDKEVFTILRMIRASGKTDKEISILSGINIKTIRRMRIGYQNGGTKYPRGITLTLLAEAAGYVRLWVSTEDHKTVFEGKESAATSIRTKGNGKSRIVTSATRKTARQKIAVAA